MPMLYARLAGMRILDVEEQQTAGTRAGQAVNYAFTFIGLFLLVFIGARAMTQLTDRTYVSGKPKVQAPFAMTNPVEGRSVLGASSQSLVDGISHSDLSSSHSQGNKSEKDKAQSASEEHSDKNKSSRDETPIVDDKPAYQVKDKINENSRRF